ncbi:MAG: hypothetical protein ACRD0C_02480 [Acidimicrobiia bacterium]
MIAAVVAVVVAAGVLIIVRGDGSSSRPSPAPGEVVQVTDETELGASIEDFTVGPDETIYAVLKDGALVSLSTGGQVRKLLPSDSDGDAEFTSIALGPEGELYLADRSSRVSVRSSDGRVRRLGSYAPAPGAAVTDPGLDEVVQMTVDPGGGALYLSDGHKVDRFEDGRLTTITGARGEERTLPGVSPKEAVAAGQPVPAGELRFDTDGGVHGLAYDSEMGDLYVGGSTELMRIDRSGTAHFLSFPEIRCTGEVRFDGRRKKLYFSVVNAAFNQAVARLDRKGDFLVLSGSDDLVDRFTFGSKGDLYAIYGFGSYMEASGDVLSELRTDLKGRAGQ